MLYEVFSLLYISYMPDMFYYIFIILYVFYCLHIFHAIWFSICMIMFLSSLYHGTIIQTGITCKKIFCYICNSA